MKMKLTALMSGMILSSSALYFSATAADKMVIAHRGASFFYDFFLQKLLESQSNRYP